MSGELRPWGGDVWVPQWLRRLFGRADAGDTPERMAESGRQSRHASYPDVSVAGHHGPPSENGRFRP